MNRKEKIKDLEKDIELYRKNLRNIKIYENSSRLQVTETHAQATVLAQRIAALTFDMEYMRFMDFLYSVVDDD